MGNGSNRYQFPSQFPTQLPDQVKRQLSRDSINAASGDLDPRVAQRLGRIAQTYNRNGVQQAARHAARQYAGHVVADVRDRLLGNYHYRQQSEQLPDPYGRSDQERKQQERQVRRLYRQRIRLQQQEYRNRFRQ